MLPTSQGLDHQRLTHHAQQPLSRILSYGRHCPSFIFFSRHVKISMAFLQQFLQQFLPFLPFVVLSFRYPLLHHII